MKASTRIKKAEQLREKLDSLILSLSLEFQKILEDDNPTVTEVCGEGFILSWEIDGDQLVCRIVNIDELLKMNKKDLAKQLKENSV